MAGRVLKEEDFEEGKDPNEKDTSESPKDAQVEIIKGKEPEEKKEPEKEAKPSADEEEPQPKPSDEKKYKYASMDDYDKAYKEAEKKMHEATTEAAELKKKVSQYEKPKEPVVTIDDRIKDLTKDTLGKIKALPADSPTRDEDAGYLWAKLQSDISDIKYEDRQKKQDTERDVVRRTYDRATKEGIKTDAELRILGYEFSKTDSSLSTEERITQAVANTKDVISQIRDGLVEKQEKDKKDKEDLKVLGRGSSRREKSEAEEDKKPTSMSQQLSELNEKRRIKKDDLRW